jgi:hypothetical protein
VVCAREGRLVNAATAAKTVSREAVFFMKVSFWVGEMLSGID